MSTFMIFSYFILSAQLSCTVSFIWLIHLVPLSTKMSKIMELYHLKYNMYYHLSSTGVQPYKATSFKESS